MKQPLDPDALRELVDDLAGCPEFWGSLVRHDPAQRHFTLLQRDEVVEIWLICWGGQDHDTGFHDHDVSSGAFAVAEGELVEERLAIGRTIRRRLRRGQSLAFPPSHVHRVHGVGETPAVSIHAYSPPLARLGVARAQGGRARLTPHTLDEDIRQSIARIKASPFVPRKDNVRGFVYHVESGELSEVA